jgi:sulfur relay (sulfurtransferase) complex TusBCD TusD component (DsrE family)
VTRHLAIVLATAPARGDLARARRLARAARAAGVEVAVFAMDDGVAALVADRAAVAALLEDDCEVIACAHSAHRRGLGEGEVGVLLGSQDDHAAIVARADRLVAFT